MRRFSSPCMLLPAKESFQTFLFMSVLSLLLKKVALSHFFGVSSVPWPFSLLQEGRKYAENWRDNTTFPFRVGWEALIWAG